MAGAPCVALLSPYQEIRAGWGTASPSFCHRLYAASCDEAVFTSSRKPSQCVRHTLGAPAADHSPSHISICAPSFWSAPVSPLSGQYPECVRHHHCLLGALAFPRSWLAPATPGPWPGHKCGLGQEPVPSFAQLPFLSAPALPGPTWCIFFRHSFPICSPSTTFISIWVNSMLWTWGGCRGRPSGQVSALPCSPQPPPLAPPTIVSRLVIWFSVLSRSCSRYRFFLSSSLARLQREPAR